LLHRRVRLRPRRRVVRAAGRRARLARHLADPGRRRRGGVPAVRVPVPSVAAVGGGGRRTGGDGDRQTPLMGLEMSDHEPRMTRKTRMVYQGLHGVYGMKKALSVVVAV